MLKRTQTKPLRALKLLKKSRNFWTTKLIRRRNQRTFSLKQEAMLSIALCEIGLNPKNLKIKIDHINGTSWVESVELGLVFPKLFFEFSRKLWPIGERTQKYFFDGYVGDDHGRRNMLAPFSDAGSAINFSDTGRKTYNKGKYNLEYFEMLAKSKFSLCPHQKDWPHKDSVIWTYRFVESCMAGAIPIAFESTPLSESFTADIYFIWDKNALMDEVQYSSVMAERNYQAALKKFTIGDLQAKTLLELIN